MRIIALFLALLLPAAAFGQLISAKTNQPVDVTAGRSTYKWEIERILLESTNSQRPVIVQGNSVLRANTIIYDDKQEIGYAFGNVSFENAREKTVLLCEEGTYFTKKKEVVAKNNPRIIIKKDGTVARAETIKIYPDRDYVNLINNVVITNSKIRMEGDQATLYQKTGKMKINGNAKAIQEKTEIHSDKIDIDAKSGQLDNYTATGNVRVIDLKEGYEIQSGRLDYFKNLGYSKITKDPVIVFTNKNIRAYSITMEKFDNEEKANLLGNVVIVQGSKKATAKWGEYDIRNKQMMLTGNPQLFQDKTRFSASKIRVDIEAAEMSMIGRGSGLYQYNKKQK